MNKKGFTLIELLGVLILLALLGLIVYPNVEKTIKNAKDNLYEDQVANIIDGAKNWVSDYPYDIPKNSGDTLTLSLCQLKIKSYVAYDIANPKTKKLFDCSTKITIKKQNNKYDYSVNFDGTTEEEKTDNLSYPNVKIIGNTLEYLKVNDQYDVSSVLLNDVVINSDTDEYSLNINIDGLDSLSGTVPAEGTYLVTYEIINKITNLKTTIYKTMIVEA